MAEPRNVQRADMAHNTVIGPAPGVAAGAGLGAALGSVGFRVTTEQLEQKSASVASRVRSMTASFSDVKRRVDAFPAYWQGDASDAYRAAFRLHQAEFEVMVRRISEHVGDLAQIAGIYNAAEREAVESTGALPDDVIV